MQYQTSIFSKDRDLLKIIKNALYELYTQKIVELLDKNLISEHSFVYAAVPYSFSLNRLLPVTNSTDNTLTYIIKSESKQEAFNNIKKYSPKTLVSFTSAPSLRGLHH